MTEVEFGSSLRVVGLFNDESWSDLPWTSRANECGDLRPLPVQHGRPVATASSDRYEIGRDADRPEWHAELLPAPCWCERTTVRLTPTQVREGVTESCGHRSCYRKLPAA